MATEAQIAANRLNAQKSTGPRTAEGKAVVAQNAVRHDGSSGKTNPIAAGGSVRSGPVGACPEGTPDGITTNGETKPIARAGDVADATLQEGQGESSASRLPRRCAARNDTKEGEQAGCVSDNDSDVEPTEPVKQSQSPAEAAAAAIEANRSWEQGVWNRTYALYPHPLVLAPEPARPDKRNKTAVRVRRT